MTSPARSSRTAGPAPESERQFQGVVVGLAQRLGWHVFHPWTSVHSAAGWPDLFMCRFGRAIAAELKSERGKVSPAQTTWLYMLKTCGVETYIWRPSDKQLIAEVLR